MGSPWYASIDVHRPWLVAIIYADAIMLHVSRPLARVRLYYSNLAAQQRTPVFIWITVRYSIIIDIVCRLCRAYEIAANPMLFLTRCVLIIDENREKTRIRNRVDTNLQRRNRVPIRILSKKRRANNNLIFRLGIVVVFKNSFDAFRWNKVKVCSFERK